MKAVVLHGYGPAGNLVLEEIEAPKPGPGEVLVKIHAAGVNPIDWKIRSGVMAKMFSIDFPAILGYDMAGIVQEVGENVTGFALGDRVFARTQRTYAEFTVAKASELAKVPEGLELTTAAAIPVVATTGDQLVREQGVVQAGQTILLTGALGSVGRFALFTAVELGARVIAGVRKNQIDEALALGATAAIDIGDEDQIARLSTLDAVCDTIGGPLASKLIEHVRPGGTYASTVGPPQDISLNPTVQIKAFGSHADAKAMAHLADAVRDGKLKLPIDLVLPLSKAAEAHAKGEKGGIGKIVLTP
jgi:NADPH:quinone reductase-like Zn-dependent oxidoreductase